MTSRILAVLIVAFGMHAFAGSATAQIFLPGPPAANVPSADVDDDSDDVIKAGPDIQSQPLAPLAGRDAPIYTVPQAPFDPRDPRRDDARLGPAPIELTAPAPAPSLAPPAAVARQIPPDQAPRPPGDIDNEKPTASLPDKNLPPEYQAETGQQKELPPNLRRQMVEYWTKEPPGTIIIDTSERHLYLIQNETYAIRYGIGVGRDGFTWQGLLQISRKAEWPDWHPPPEMITRQPYLPRFMAGGPGNPLGARAMYLGNTVYRIHGTNMPQTIGTKVSSGCFRLTNPDVSDLYDRVPVGTKVIIMQGPQV